MMQEPPDVKLANIRRAAFEAGENIDGLELEAVSQESAEVLKSARIAAKRIVTLLNSDFEASPSCLSNGVVYPGLSEIER